MFNPCKIHWHLGITMNYNVYDWEFRIDSSCVYTDSSQLTRAFSGQIELVVRFKSLTRLLLSLHSLLIHFQGVHMPLCLYRACKNVTM